MKKIITILLTAILIITSAACTSAPVNTETGGEDSTLKVITTIFPQYDFSREIGKDKISLSMLLPPGSETHSFEPTPKDIVDIENCDVFIYVGGESESWVDTILDSVDTSSVRIISLMDAVSVVEEETVEGMQTDDSHDHDDNEEHDEHDHEDEDHDHEDHEIEYDEHVWTSPVNAIKISETIGAAFEELDTENADFYKSNLEDYITRLEALDTAFREISDNAVRRTLVFGDRFPFRYFTDEYDFDYYAAFPGCSTETGASAQTVAFLIDTIKDNRIKAVFHIEFSNERMADTIAESTGAEKLLLHSCHNVSLEDIENGTSYITLMEQNAENLKEALY